MLSQIRERDERFRPNGDPRIAQESLRLLQQMVGPDAAFRDGQLEAIEALAQDRGRILVVQKTGWGKSLVYFIATRLLRDQGAGPTFLISPLLSLMRNQEAMAARIGVRARRLDSSNREAWLEIQQELRDGTIDLLMVSPERLANHQFRTEVLPVVQQGIGMVVVDEAHCISDWGHDFRPDYRRIVQIVRQLPATIPVLATTATANDRVVEDIREQLGSAVQVLRGPLARPTLRLQTILLGGQGERLAWLATHLPAIPGTGVIYCLTVRDTELVAGFLNQQGIDVRAYHADLDNESRVDLEHRLLNNEVKGLCATVALGMGFDKPDLGYVIHFQRPGSVIAYYQQIGRAGRSERDAFAILLSGHEDDEIQEYFINTAFPGAENLVTVANTLADSDGMTMGQLEQDVNLSHKRLEQCLKFLEVEGAVVKEGTLYQRTAVPWTPDVERSRRVTEQRYRELERMQEFVRTERCLMEFVARELDDPEARPCGRCANCAGDVVPRTFDPPLAEQAAAFLGRSWIPIEPRKMLPYRLSPEKSQKIDLELVNEQGLALCAYKDAGLGDLVRAGKYGQGRFDDRLVEAAHEAILATWPVDQTWWVTPVPSRRHAELVRDFAIRLALRLGLPCAVALTKTHETAGQKLMQNSAQQLTNILHAFRVDTDELRAGPVILIDDMVDSGWTLAICGAHLRKAGSGPVYPFVLASQRGGAS